MENEEWRKRPNEGRFGVKREGNRFGTTRRNYNSTSYGDERGDRPRYNSSSRRGNGDDFSGNRSQRPVYTRNGERDASYGNRQQHSYNPNKNYENRRNSRYNQESASENTGFQKPSYRREENSYNRSSRSWNSRDGQNANRRSYSEEGQRPQYRSEGRYQRREGGYRDFTKRPVYTEKQHDPNEPMRLNKYLANAGVCSRREADDFITAGVVSVNGEVVTELGTKVKRSDIVKFHDQTVTLEGKVYVLLNKPKDCVTTSDDPQARLTVMDLVKNACPERIYPVGRLDRNTTGVLLLTNDGELASKLTHPKFLKKKIYHVFLDKCIGAEDMQKIAAGIELEDGEIHADQISYIDEAKADEVGIEIHSGKNRIVRRIFESLGYKVVKLDRVYFAGLTKKGLRRGEWRYLSPEEVGFLKMGSFE